MNLPNQITWMETGCREMMDIFYFTKPVDPDKYTDYLLETVSGKSGVTFPQEGYLELNVLVDAIQATNTKAANDAWGTPTTNQGKTNIY